MNLSTCIVCSVVGDKKCKHDEYTVLLMTVWLKKRPKSLLEFYLCVYEEPSLRDSNKNINKSIKKFVECYNLYE